MVLVNLWHRLAHRILGWEYVECWRSCTMGNAINSRAFALRTWQHRGQWWVTAPGWGLDTLDEQGTLASWAAIRHTQPVHAHPIHWRPLTPGVAEFYKGDTPCNKKT